MLSISIWSGPKFCRVGIGSLFPKQQISDTPKLKEQEMTILNLMKMAESSPIGKKTLWEKEKLFVMSYFSFSHSVFKRLVQHTLKNQGLFGKRLMKTSREKEQSPKLSLILSKTHWDLIASTLEQLFHFHLNKSPSSFKK